VGFSLKIVILAGGLGTRLLAEESTIPKPMVEIGQKPILWHIMNFYSGYGFNDFIIALGYKSEVIRNYFINYHAISQNLHINLAPKKITPQFNSREKWRIDLIDTGLNTLTGGRVLRLRELLDDQTFMLTYGDGLADINILDLLNFHKSHGKLMTVSAVRPPARFGELVFDAAGAVEHFTEKPQVGGGWINGGFMVCEPTIFSYLEKNGDQASLETDAMEALAKDGELRAYTASKFWQCMDTPRDKVQLEKLWQSGEAPWKRP
jgi:glucose-1-phosphate cytidylyltransferase